MPLFRYDPTVAGVFGTRINLDGNPKLNESLIADEGGDRLLTAADWAIAQQRFKTHFQALGKDAATPVPLPEWLQLDARGRERKTPYLAIGDGEHERRYSMSTAMIEMAEQRLADWQTLQELAGIVTPFTEQVEQDIRAELAAEHQAELDAQKRASDEQLRAIQEKTEAEIASKIRSRLLELASRKRG